MRETSRVDEVEERSDDEDLLMAQRELQARHRARENEAFLCVMSEVAGEAYLAAYRTTFAAAFEATRRALSG